MPGHDCGQMDEAMSERVVGVVGKEEGGGLQCQTQQAICLV